MKTINVSGVKIKSKIGTSTPPKKNKSILKDAYTITQTYRGITQQHNNPELVLGYCFLCK